MSDLFRSYGYEGFDFEAEAQAAEALVESLLKVDAPHKLVEQARKQVIWLRERAAETEHKGK